MSDCDHARRVTSPLSPEDPVVWFCPDCWCFGHDEEGKPEVLFYPHFNPPEEEG